MMSAMHHRRQSAGFSLVELLLALTLMSMLLALAYWGLAGQSGGEVRERISPEEEYQPEGQGEDAR